MEGWSQLGLGWAMAACFVLAIVSAIFPWVNAEIIVLSLPAVAKSQVDLVVLVLVAAAGQMAGKCAVYWGSRTGLRLPTGRIAAVLARWRTRVAARPRSPLALVLLSSTVGIPPFYLMTMVAGALKVNFLEYLLVGTCGRLLRFSALVIGSAFVLQYFT